MRRRTVITIAIASFGAGCGLISGLDNLHTGDADAAQVDGAPDVVLVQCDGGCGFTLPAGFTLVTYASTLPITCPDGTAPADVVADPGIADPAACTCKCAMKTKATCSATTVNLLLSDGGFSSCPNTYTTLPSGAPGCHQVNLSLPSNIRADESGNGKTLLDAGTCQTSEVADASTLTSTAARVCLPSTCAVAETICKPPAGQRLCAVSNGEVACPAPFTERHLIGASATVACSTCDSACTINPPNCDFTSTLTLYSDNACGTTGQGITNCTLYTGPTTVKSYDYKITASGGCTTSATSTASPSLAAEQTVCCQPGN